MKSVSKHKVLVFAGWFMLGWLLAFNSSASAQFVPTHISNQGIYLFLDELATEKVIDLYSLVKPYSRQDIAALLAKADSSRSVLNRRQQDELDFYQRDYGKELPAEDSAAFGSSWLWLNHDKRFDAFHYRDSMFRITVNPILGTDVWFMACSM